MFYLKYNFTVQGKNDNISLPSSNLTLKDHFSVKSVTGKT